MGWACSTGHVRAHACVLVCAHVCLHACVCVGEALPLPVGPEDAPPRPLPSVPPVPPSPWLLSRTPAPAAPAPGSGLRDRWERDSGRRRGAGKGRRAGQAPPEPHPCPQRPSQGPGSVRAQLAQCTPSPLALGPAPPRWAVARAPHTEAEPVTGPQEAGRVLLTEGGNPGEPTPAEGQPPPGPLPAGLLQVTVGEGTMACGFHANKSAFSATSKPPVAVIFSRALNLKKKKKRGGN